MARLSEEFRIDPPAADNKLSYYWLRVDGFADRSECDAPACARGTTAFATHAPLNHELVHGIAHHFGTSSSFFAEGLAVAYQGLGASYHMVEGVSDVDTLDMFELDSAALRQIPGGYERAGSLISYLLTEYGPEAVLRLYDGIQYGSDFTEADHRFIETLGTPLGEVLTAFEASPPCPSYARDAKLMECNAPAIDWDGSSHKIERRLDCADPSVVGPFSGDEIIVFQTIDVTTAGVYELRRAGDTRVSRDMWEDFDVDLDAKVTGVSIVSCGACETAQRLSTRVGDGPRTARLEPGRFSLRLHGTARTPTNLAFQLTRLSD